MVSHLTIYFNFKLDFLITNYFCATRSDKNSFQQVLEEFLFPYVNDTMEIAEIGSGGGMCNR